MNSREVIYRILYSALVDLRIEGHSTQNKKVFAISDLLHTVPLKLAKMDSVGDDYDSLLRWLQERAKDKGLENWMSSVEQTHKTGKLSNE